MSIKINKTQAAILLRTAATEADLGQFDSIWFKKVERLSQLCEVGVSKTHIAFLGTAMIAKAMRLDVDLFAIKPLHAKNNPNAFSARTLCHSVLVPLAADLAISIGVTGREPLNNQPYFRMTRLGDDTPVHSGGRAAFDYMVKLIDELQTLSTKEDARAALVAFIAERRRHQPRYTAATGETLITAGTLSSAIRALIQAGSESGRRAQAAVAGLMDAFAGPDRVESGRINDPSRRHPGDVCVRAVDDPDTWEKAFEVRDKPVTASDVKIFANKCIDMGVREAAIVAIADSQASLDDTKLSEWANELGMGMTLFTSWESIVDQTLFWAGEPKSTVARRAVGFIHDRLIAVETTPEAVSLWAQLTHQ